MSNELSVSGQLRYEKNGIVIHRQANARVDISGDKITEIVQEIGTSEEAIDLGDITSPGYMLIENLDDTNFVSIRAASGETDLIKVPSKKMAGPFMLSSSGPYAIADTAACKVRFIIIEQ